MSDFTASELRDRIQKQVEGERDIITSAIFPPINVRGLDWCAVFDGYEPGCPIGHGATEAEAIQDLRDKSPYWPEDVLRELRDEQAEQDAREQESDVHADAIEALDELEAAQDFNQ